MSVSVSVVLGVYNDAAYVADALESIRAQTFVDWELIVVDDGSTDDTPRILRRFVQCDDRIRVITQENSGLTRALVRGCEAARGEFIARQDADDLSLPHRFDRQLALLHAQPQVGLMSSWALHMAPREEPLEIVQGPADPAEATRQLIAERRGPSAHGSVMFRRDVYRRAGGYRPEFYYAQDIDLWLRMTEGSQLGCVGECLYLWRRSASGISGAQFAAQQQFADLAFACRTARERNEPEAPVLKQAEELTASMRRRHDARRTATRELLDTEYLIGSQLAQNGDRRAAGYLWKVLQRRPWHWKAWCRLLQTGLRARRGNGSRVVDPRPVFPDSGAANDESTRDLLEQPIVRD